MWYFSCFMAIFFFSTIEIVGKLIGSSISPVAITVYRFLIGAFLILPFAIREYHKTKLSLSLKDILLISYPGILNVTISMLFLQLGIYYGKANVSAILVSTNAIFVAIFAVFILHETLSFHKITGIIIGFVGISMIIVGGNNDISLHGRFMLGVLFGVGAAITFGLYTVVSKLYVQRYGNFVFNTISFFSGALVLFIAGLFLHIDYSMPMQLTPILYILYLGLIVTGLSYILFFAGLKHIPAASGSMFFFLKPAIATLLAYFILHETVTFWQIFGILFIIMGLNTERLTHKAKELFFS